MSGVLLTGFEPFGGEPINPSWEAVRALEGRVIAGQRVSVRCLPCVFGEARQAIQQAMDELDPVVTLAVGQAGGRVDISVERVAINIDDARIPDNRGQQPIDEPVVEEGPAAHFSTLPIKAIVGRLREAGIPASVSQTAGTFVCNHVMYALLHKLQGRAGVKGGFIHIPYLPEQASAHSGAPSMSLERVQAALELAIEVALREEDDRRVAEGSTH